MKLWLALSLIVSVFAGLFGWAADTVAPEDRHKYPFALAVNWGRILGLGIMSLLWCLAVYLIRWATR